MHAEHFVGLHVDDELHQRLLITSADHRTERPEARLVDVDDTGALKLARLLLRESDRADLGLGEHSRRDDPVIDLGGLGIE
jgi:hypothetical protein